jgi:hypothetical protein
MEGWNTTSLGMPNTTIVEVQKYQEVVNSQEKLIIVKEIFLDISKQMLKTSYTLNLGQLLKISKFNYCLTIVTNYGVHFINDAIKYLIDHFLLKHVSSTTYYPQGNGQALQQKRGILRSKYPRKQQRNQIPKTRSSEQEFVTNS